MAPAKPEKFETNLQMLEDLVQKLEEGDLSLEESLKAFEGGMGLVKACEKRLSEAQKKVEILMKDGKTKDFEVEE
jgi:exodeoxyribonuclease VII small subunit